MECFRRFDVFGELDIIIFDALMRSVIIFDVLMTCGDFKIFSFFVVLMT